MEIIKALILGIVQGLTEFLPISSSGHLEIVNHLLQNTESIDSDLLMVVIVHLGTAFSILYVFRSDISNILTSLFTFRKDEDFSLALKIVISMVPALFVGLLFESQIEALFASSILLYVGLFLCITALVLWFTPKDNKEGRVSYAKAIWIGIAQAIAILPGISRSGMTIAVALFLNVDKIKAARFSFLMVLPVIFGKVILDVISGDLLINSKNSLPLIVALFTSFIVGVYACKWMLRIIQNSQLSHFAIYCFIVGSSIIISYFF